MSTVDKNLYKVGDLVKFRGPEAAAHTDPEHGRLALVIEKTPGMMRYRIKWCRSGEAHWVWGYNLAPAY